MTEGINNDAKKSFKYLLINILMTEEINNDKKVGRKVSQSISPRILIFMRLCSPSSRLQTLRREIRDVTREKQVHLRHAYACGMRMHSYARVHAETKPRTLFYEWVHRGERDKAKGRKLPSNSVCVMCVSDFYLPLTTAILHTRLYSFFSPSLIFFHPSIFLVFF